MPRGPTRRPGVRLRRHRRLARGRRARRRRCGDRLRPQQLAGADRTGRPSTPASTCWSRSQWPATPKRLEAVVKAACRAQVVRSGSASTIATTGRDAQGPRAVLGQGAIGELTFLRCRYGHGGRPGTARSGAPTRPSRAAASYWTRASTPFDLFPLVRGRVLGRVPGMIAQATSGTVGGQVEDNGFAQFRTAGGQIAQLHASWTQWKNIFSFEVFGRDGYLVAEGLGGSYGPERLSWGRRRPGLARPSWRSTSSPPGDTSWQREWDELSPPSARAASRSGAATAAGRRCGCSGPSTRLSARARWFGSDEHPSPQPSPRGRGSYAASGDDPGGRGGHPPASAHRRHPQGHGAGRRRSRCWSTPSSGCARLASPTS